MDALKDAFANLNKPKNQKQQPDNAPQPQQVKKPKEFRAKPNIGWLFYKEYFKDIIYEDININETQENFENRMKNKYRIEINNLNSRAPNDKAQLHNILYKNEVVVNKKISSLINQGFTQQKPKTLGNIGFTLKTTYPGLLVGSGNTHELPDTKGQAMLGFHFDYTSGLPEIAGSSVKGVLRSAFEHQEYIKDILGDTFVDVKKLELEIFGQESKSGEVEAGTDVFFDAIVIKGNAQGKILGDDFITPHKVPTKNPVPIRFIKVIPGVEFEFRFSLNDGVVTKEQKQDLFRQIILDFGLGAKTNVGYGKFQEIA